MKSERLERVIERVERLPAAQQNAIARAMEREMEEMEWDALIAQPRSQRLLDDLAAEAHRADAAGETRDAGDDW